jgi:hypothetical protein
VATLSVAARNLVLLENVTKGLQQYGNAAKAGAEYLLAAPVNLTMADSIRSQQVGPQAFAMQVMANAIRDGAPRGVGGLLVIVIDIFAGDTDGTR